MKYLPESWENLFQKIKKIVRDYEEKNWKWSSINIAVWEPDKNPPKTLREIVAKNVLKDENWIHTYWDNRAPLDYVEEVVKHHTWIKPSDYPELKWLALPGEKPMLGLLPIACWANLKQEFDNEWYVRNAPAYDIMWTWSGYLWEESFIWPIYSNDDFKLKISNLPIKSKPPRMIITVKPWNPCPVWAKKEDWVEIIKYCIENNIRLVNDAAYSWVVHEEHISLTEVAKDYKELEWMELFSLSKTMNACGWRLWCAFWSGDFIDELSKIKWNSDSWAFGPALVSIPEYLKHPNSKGELLEIKNLYKKRLSILIPILKEVWFIQACPTDAWFFTLWMLPKTLNWIQINSAEQFNNIMIDTIWLVWIPFMWSQLENGDNENFIRYSVCAPFEDDNFVLKVKNALLNIKITY